MVHGSQPISGLPLEELEKILQQNCGLTLPHFRTVQIFKWIASGAYGFEEMSNLPQALRKELAEKFILRPPSVVEKNSGDDGSIKLALQFSDGVWVEAVLLSDNSGRRTVCLSTQAGCPVGCVFCKTGKGFSRNLNSAEIVEQFLLLVKAAAEISAEDSGPPSGADSVPGETQEIRPVSNIVVMGMGEPLLNLGELRRALDVITCKQGIGFSKRRITVSTCGIAQGITDLADNGPAVRLALSLTTADEDLRRRLMPITASQPLNKVKEALLEFQERGGGRVTLEAVLLGGVNTRPEDAQSIANFAKGLDAVVNLIPWNPVKGLEFEGKALCWPSAAEVETFTQNLEKLGLNVTRRFRRGRGVMGACGQLGSRSLVPGPFCL
jgi:23S rRNA (adenine2503-C2)-methyltransferase